MLVMEFLEENISISAIRFQLDVVLFLLLLFAFALIYVVLGLSLEEEEKTLIKEKKGNWKRREYMKLVLW